MDSPEPNGADKRVVAFLTGTRADFGKIQPLASALPSDGYKVLYFVTGMHMLQRYGDTRMEVRRERESGADIFEFINQAPGDSHDLVLAKTMQGFGDWLSEHPADLVVVHGDRVEALAVALVCAMRYVRCAHVEGGEVSGTIDEVYRHCITKLSGYHFVSAESAARRVRSLGEPDESIFVVGSPELDVHSRPSSLDMEEVRMRYGLPDGDFGIAIFHPVTSELESIGQQAKALFESLSASERQYVVILPNNDPGTELIIDVIGRLDQPQFRVLPSMRFEYFSEMLRNASCVVGNSSVGVREAPFLGLPSLNIGTRQARRSNSASIEHASAFDTEVIARFLRVRWGYRFPSSAAFGKGGSSGLFRKALDLEGFWNRPIQKRFEDLATTPATA